MKTSEEQARDINFIKSLLAAKQYALIRGAINADEPGFGKV